MSSAAGGGGPPTRRRRREEVPRPFRRPRWTRGIQRKRVKYDKVVYPFKRVTNASRMSGFDVDGVALVKSVGAPSTYFDMVAAGPSGNGQMNYGSFAFSWRLSDIIDFTEFTSLFDQYKVKGFKIRIIPFNTESPTMSATAPVGSTNTQFGHPNCMLHWAIDENDASLPAQSETGVETLQQYSSYKFRRVTDGSAIEIYVPAPKVVGEVFAQSGTGGAPKKNPWLTTDNSDVEHFGVKGVFVWGPIVSMDAGEQADIRMRIEVISYIACKNTI